MFTINCKGKLITTEMPLIMGIINATPDSFYKADVAESIDDILGKVTSMINDGADIIDVGGQSTKPNSDPVFIEEEIKRVVPVIEKIVNHFPNIIISIDTYQSEVAKAALAAGASMVNDISGGQLDKEMISTVGKYGNVPYVCMHTKGTPKNMQQLTNYEDVTKEVLEYFVHKIEECKNAGIVDMIIDPGFGFAKTIEQNFILLKNLSIFKMLDKPILVGISRKSTIYKTLNISVEEALNGTTVFNTLALYNGANILRVHDVLEAKQAVTLVEKYKYASYFLLLISILKITFTP